MMQNNYRVNKFSNYGEFRVNISEIKVGDAAGVSAGE